jgi:fructokinase
VRVGVDLGGTKIEAIALADSGAIVARERVATPRAYEPTLDAIVGLVEAVERGAGGRGSVGIGIPGAVSPATGLVKNANSVWLIGQPLGRDLEARLGRPVRLENDANCFAISEASDGAAAGEQVVFGEWGHNPLPWMTADEFPGPECYCGKRGCIEMFVSGLGFARDYEAATGEPLSSHDIVANAQAGDRRAIANVDRYVDRLARGLSSVINLLDPDVIVLGGGMSNLPRLAESVSVELPRYVFSDTVQTRVVRNQHGDSSGVRGAAWLWPLTQSIP